MSRLRFSQLTRFPAAAAAVLAGLLTVSACSNSDGGDEKKYAVPGVLCEIKVEADLLDPFLPGGDSITTRTKVLSGGAKQCDVIVDGQVAVREIQSWWNEGESATEVAAAYAKTDGGKVTDDGRFLYSGEGAVGKTSEDCKSTEHPDQNLYGIIQVFAKDRSDSQAMEKLITSYVQGLEASTECG